jgi:hypothetical protein
MKNTIKNLIDAWDLLQEAISVSMGEMVNHPASSSKKLRAMRKRLEEYFVTEEGKHRQDSINLMVFHIDSILNDIYKYHKKHYY